MRGPFSLISTKLFVSAAGGWRKTWFDGTLTIPVAFGPVLVVEAKMNKEEEHEEYLRRMVEQNTEKSLKDPEKCLKALRLFSEASELEDEGKIQQAVERYLVSAQMGHSSAQNNLATLLDGKVTPSRPKEAVYWYKRAVRSGDCIAAWNMAMHHRNRGKRRWQIHWLRVAVRMGHDEAAEELRKLVRLVKV